MGIDSYWSYDHPAANADCWTALAALAVSTERIRLGTMVDRIYYRLPSGAAGRRRRSRPGGRLVLGLGIGRPEGGSRSWVCRSTNAHPATGAEETFAILRGLWSGELFSIAVRALRRDPDRALPPPVQEPHAPFLLAGGGEKTTLRQVARFADAANMGAHPAIGQAVSDEDIARKFDHPEEVVRGVWTSLRDPRTHFTMPLVLAPTRPRWRPS